MNWEAIGAIAEVAGAVAVIATLIYLSTQLRQGISSIHNQTSWAVTQAMNNLNAQSVASGEVTEIWLRGCENPDSLDNAELWRFRSYTLSWLNLVIYVYTHPTPEHAFFIPYVADLTRTQPGFKMIVAEIRESFPVELYDQLTGGDDNDASTDDA